jgi:hypothetical protein
MALDCVEVGNFEFGLDGLLFFLLKAGLSERECLSQLVGILRVGLGRADGGTWLLLHFLESRLLLLLYQNLTRSELRNQELVL